MHVLGAGLVAQLEKDLLAMRATRVRLLGWEDHPGEVNDTPLQYSCLENLMDRGAWQATVHGVTRVGHDLAAKLPHHKYQMRVKTGSGVRTAWI